MPFTKQEAEEVVKSLPYWWHSINLGHGILTNGIKTPNHLAEELRALRLPDLTGKTVLDIGAWDGFYSFTAEQLGAKRVMALDYDAWRIGIGCKPDYEKECKDQGTVPHPLKDHVRNLIWLTRPGELLGKRNFDAARLALNSKVESLYADFMTVDLGELGMFDVALLLGVLYHIQNPLECLKRVAAVTREVAIIETEAVAIPGFEHHGLCEFFPSDELNADPSNWWAPNQKALVGMCCAAGFRRVEMIVGPPTPVPESHPSHTQPMKNFRRSLASILKRPDFPRSDTPAREQLQIQRYRAVVHAWK